MSKALGISRILVAELVEQTAAAREGRIFVRKGRKISPQAFETDPRVYSLGALSVDSGLSHQVINKSPIARRIVSEAVEAQLSGHPYTVLPNLRSVLERFRREPLIALRCHRTLKVMLYARDALCVVFGGQLATEVTRQDRVQLVTTGMFNIWLGGITRSRGKHSREDSVFNRFNIIDPRSGRPASLTVHDLRHWLTTAYADGGISKDQMTVVFNRKSAGCEFDVHSDPICGSHRTVEASHGGRKRIRPSFRNLCPSFRG